MRKITSAIPIVAILCIITFLFVYMCLPEKQGAEGVTFTFSTYLLRTRGLYFAVLGGIFMIGFYHLTLYIFRRRETAYLLFSLLCMICIIHFLFIEKSLNDFFYWIPAGMLLSKLNHITFFLYHYSMIILMFYVFVRRFLLTHKKAFVAYLIFGTFYFCVFPASVLLYKSIAILFITVVALFALVVAFRSSVLGENKWTWLYFVSGLFYTGIAFVNNIFLVGFFFMPGLLSSLFLILSQSLLLSKNYTDAFKLVEETNTNLEKIVDDRTKDLQNTNNAMKELVGNISHDLKTPLAVMSINLEELSNLSQTLSDENYAKCVRSAFQKNLDLQRLIQNLMEVSRIETAQGLLRLEWIPLSELLSQAQDKYDDYLKDKGIFLEISCTGNAEIHADPQRIWNVFDNIVYNAARYTGEDGTISIHAAVSEKIVTITITDTGGGIAPEHLPHIFERFYKADPSRGTGGDSGLGLYIVKSIMEASDGSVAATCESGKGSSIILRFVKK